MSPSATAVNTAKSFPLISFRSPGTNFNCNDFVRAKITSATNLRLSSDVTGGAVALSVVEWQVVQYQDANVRSGDVAFTATDGSRTAALAPAVNTAKSWLIYSYETTPNSIPDIGQYLVRGQLTDSTTLTFDRSNTGTVGLTLSWYLVEFTDASTVQSGSQAFLTADTAIDVTLPLPAPPGTSMALGGGDYQRGGRSSYSADDIVGVGWFNFDLTASSNLRITRGAGGLAPADVGWFVVTFSASTAVTLVSFEAAPSDGAVDLTWRTGSEVDNLGFHVYRSLSDRRAPGRGSRRGLIPGQGFSAMGAGLRVARQQPHGTASATSTGSRTSTRRPCRPTTAPFPPCPAGTTALLPPGAAGGGGGGSIRLRRSPSCPAWALAQLGSSASYTCGTHGDPGASSLRVLSRTSRSALVELETAGFLTARDATGRVRTLLPGFDSLSDPLAPALPLKRARLDGVVGRQARIGSIQARENRFFTGLVAAADGTRRPSSRDGTVQPGRREAELGLSHGVFPRVQARLAGEGFQGEDKTLALELMPLRYDASRGALVLSRRLTVRVDFAGAEPSEIGRGRLGRRIPARAPTRTPTPSSPRRTRACTPSPSRRSSPDDAGPSTSPRCASPRTADPTSPGSNPLLG